MKRLLFSMFILILSISACGKSPATTPTITISPVPTTSSSKLWYLTRGEAKSDQAWGVSADSSGNIYTAGYYQSPAPAQFYDMVIYKFTSDGTELWRTQWGQILEEKAFVVWVQEPYVYLGGTQHTSAALDEADMAILALDMDTGEVELYLGAGVQL